MAAKFWRARRAPADGGVFGNDRDWERLWRRISSAEWHSLVIVPADASIDAQRVAQALVAVAALDAASAVSLIDGRQTSAAGVAGLLDGVGALVADGKRVLIALDPLADSPAAASIARGAGRALLVVRAGESRIQGARDAVDAIGTDRVIGSVVLE